MKTIRILLLLLITGIGIGIAAPASAETPEERLIGVWEEYEPSSNVIQFYDDHTLRLYLTEEEGGDADPPMHYIEGTWHLSSKGMLTMRMSANDKEVTKTLKLVFRDEEMVLVDDDDGETVHRPLVGPLPAKYRW